MPVLPPPSSVPGLAGAPVGVAVAFLRPVAALGAAVGVGVAAVGVGEPAARALLLVPARVPLVLLEELVLLLVVVVNVVVVNVVVVVIDVVSQPPHVSKQSK